MEKREKRSVLVTVSLLLAYLAPLTAKPSRRGNSKNDLRYSVNLDQARKLQLRWDIDDVLETVYFQLEAKITTRQWLGFGFSDYGEADNADFIILWTDWNGHHHFQDAHTDGRGILKVDKSQDYELDDVRPSTDGVIIQFHRKYDTCDDHYDYIIDSGTTHMIFFIQDGLLPTIRGLNITQFQPELQRTQIIKSQIPDPEFPSDTRSVDMTVANVHVPAVETTYWCRIRKLPPMPHKQHVIQFEGIISPDSVGIVHHMEVFHCEVPPGEAPPFYDAPCSSEQKPKELEVCRKVIGAWAMGALPLTYPAEAGYPIGGKDFSRYVMMEIHYNNPSLRRGIIDNSGIRFYYTPTLRKYDAATMELGLEYTDKMALPPRQSMWDLIGYCIPDCTRGGLPRSGIKIFASQLHTHLTGKRVYTKHFRHGVEMPELNRDNHYSPHYQEIRKLKKPVTILPGDSLVTVCRDSTKDRSQVTLGGFAISDEMCVNYVHYYPKTALEVCKSSIATNSLLDFFRFMAKYMRDQTSPTKGISDNYKSIHWNSVSTKLLRTLYDKSPMSMQCNQSDGSRFPGNWEDKQIPKVFFPMPPEERPCLQK